MPDDVLQSGEVETTSATSKTSIRAFCAWAGDNPISFVMVLMVILGGVSLIAGYREGFTAIVTGLFSWIKGTDKENQAKLVEAKARADTAAKAVMTDSAALQDAYALHDSEVKSDGLSARATAENLDVDELIDAGQGMVRDYSAFAGSKQ